MCKVNKTTTKGSFAQDILQKKKKKKNYEKVAWMLVY